jgi:acyl-CoA reductase-like NAD-dependent aldehyde dehydrogenase
MKKKLEVINPYTQKIIKSINNTTKQELDFIVKELRNNQIELQNKSLTQRKKLISNFIEQFREHTDELAETFSTETGIVIKESRPGTEKIIRRMQYFLDIADETLKPEITQVDPDTMNTLSKSPYGLVGIITTWNYLYVPMVMMIPAFLAGNCIILKASQFSSKTMQLIEGLLQTTSLDKYIKFIYGESQTGIDLINSEIDSLAFVGRTQTGKDIMKLASGKVLPLMLGLSGKDAFTVLEDNDLALIAKEIITGGFRNNGESCASVEIVFVPDKLYSNLLDPLSKELDKLIVGDQLDSNTDIGPIATGKDFIRIQEQINDAVAKGAEIVYSHKSGIQKNHQIISPIILSKTTNDMLIRQEETFAPIIVLEKYSNISSVINYVNNSKFGLTSSVWSNNQKLAEEVGNKLNVGLTCINCLPRSDERYPWGGIRESGYGKILSKFAFDSFTYIKNFRVKKIH